MGEELVTQERASLHPFYAYGFVNTEYPSALRVTNTR
jgi:hypothetical protein